MFSPSCTNFNPRAPCGARQLPFDLCRIALVISIPAPLAGRDRPRSRSSAEPLGFQSPRPLRGATMDVSPPPVPPWYFNPRAPCGARLGGDPLVEPQPAISIPAPLAGRDHLHSVHDLGAEISIPAPLAGRDSPAGSLRWRRCHFNPRAPCGARPGTSRCPSTARSYFNPRAPCGARPGRLLVRAVSADQFQSPRPLRGATVLPVVILAAEGISIPAPLAGRDISFLLAPKARANFNPRAPCGARRLRCSTGRYYCSFQSPRPLRGATVDFAAVDIRGPISIPAPLAGRDFWPCWPAW